MTYIIEHFRVSGNGEQGTHYVARRLSAEDAQNYIDYFDELEGTPIENILNILNIPNEPVFFLFKKEGPSKETAIGHLSITEEGISYALKEQGQKKFLMPLLLHLAERYAIDHNYPSLRAQISSENQESINVIKRAGFSELTEEREQEGDFIWFWFELDLGPTRSISNNHFFCYDPKIS